MGHGKETPRQKMIGMMYLMLTAMLALNVQKSVLDAFVNVDEGLTKTIENFHGKNQMVYQDIAQEAATNPEKALTWKNKADKVMRLGDSLYDYIQDLKIEIIKTSDGDDAPAIHGREIHPMKIKGKDNTDVPAQIMVGDNNDGKAIELKKAITDYEEYLISLIDKEDTAVISSIKKNLDTSDPPPVEGRTPTWESENFEHLPLIGVTTIMSGMQSDVRNAEAEMLRYLYSKIDEGAFKFNKVEVTVIPNSNYVIQGNEYRAQVFLSAVDTTQPPTVLVGDYDSTKLESGAYRYEMEPGYDSIPVVSGKGIFTYPASQTGFVEWGGIIKLRKPDGSFLTKPFRQEFQVAEPSVVISPTKMNVFYMGIDNPVKIEVAGVPSDKVFPRISNGAIRPSGNAYIVRPARLGKATVSVTAEVDGKKSSMGSMEFRVQNVPDPMPMVGGKKGGTIRLDLLQALDGIYATMGEDFLFDLEFTVTGFTISTMDKGGFMKEEESNSSRFTQGQVGLLNKLRRNDKVWFENITAVGPDGKERNLSSMSFRVI